MSSQVVASRIKNVPLTSEEKLHSNEKFVKQSQWYLKTQQNHKNQDNFESATLFDKYFIKCKRKITKIVNSFG